MKIPVISISNKIIDILNTTVICCLIHIRGNDRFELEISKNKNLIFSLLKFMESLNFLYRYLQDPWIPG